ncbi:MAG: rhodanese-like domain-containing protein [Gammaproteobacteria bacterium]|nr:rhodanese-like domain-containing protein [Gammaproteobacteria bacterium]MCB1851704.1 rhodanese-like domain-containing protein [Gammaproteobacteria bacterium]MCP5417174.1 rhodanese-like domain-containing protein [Chromatiaceae bacterium]
MEQYIEFASNHPYLFAALGAVSFLLIHNFITGMDKSVVHPNQAIMLINQEEAVVVDVRPMADFSTGHIINSINLPINGLKNQINRLEKYKSKPIIVACRSGAQSSSACKQLRKEGFEKVFNLRGGILAWQDANLPVSRKK